MINHHIVVDCHCHAGPGDIMTDPWNTNAPLDDYFKRAQEAGIDRTVVFAAFNSDYAKANARVARILRAHPGRLTGFAFVHPQRDAGRIERMVGQAVENWGFRGIKVHGRDGQATREVCEAAKKFRVPLLVDVYSQAAVVDMLAPQYPQVNFIIPHLGSFAGDWKTHQQVVDQLVRCPNVYTDTSGVQRFDYIVQAVRRAGARKVLFGSDGPWLHPGVELAKIKLLKLKPEAEALVLGGNLLRLIGETQQPAKKSTPGVLQNQEIEDESALAPYHAARRAW